ncbi:MAG: hypothetical protein IKS92_13590 [Victivallales bacterium]|nr:hypothetical protein [Victivallales bacterium]MBR5023910.1 hypothetical protein [Victivallales bacterium]MBR5837113.1 hypothetical protein [Victivallales bacterium]
MENNQKKISRASKIFKATFYIMLAWACAAAFATSYIRPVHSTTDLCSLTRKIFHLYGQPDWKMDVAQANAILNSTALQSDGHAHALALSPVAQQDEMVK